MNQISSPSCFFCDCEHEHKVYCTPSWVFANAQMNIKYNAHLTLYSQMRRWIHSWMHIWLCICECTDEQTAECTPGCVFANAHLYTQLNAHLTVYLRMHISIQSKLNTHLDMYSQMHIWMHSWMHTWLCICESLHSWKPIYDVLANFTDLYFSYMYFRYVSHVFQSLWSWLLHRKSVFS